MNRHLSLLLILAITLGLLSGCGSDAAPTEEDDGALRVISTIFPGYDFARAVGGEHIHLSMLLSPGSESHSFEPTPQDIIAIQNCDVFLYVGGESDSWVDGILDSMDTSGMTILPMLELVEVVEEELVEGMQGEHDEHEDEDGAHEIELDEHVWTAPLNALRIVRAIESTLCGLDLDNAEAYHANANAMAAGLEALDADLRAVAEQAARKTLVFGDRFPFRYLADAYGLNYSAAFPGCSTETEASAKTVAFLIDKVRDEAIPVVFHIEFSNGKTADTICESTGAKKLQLHSCHNVTNDDFKSGATYLSLMAQNIQNLKEALS